MFYDFLKYKNKHISTSVNTQSINILIYNIIILKHNTY